MILFYAVSVSAQHKTKLFYFTENKKNISYIGVKDETGKIIIPAEMQNVMEIPNGETAEGKLLSFFGCPKNIQPEQHAWGCVFDRKGKYLYQTFAFDNGADYRVEGYQRIVKNGKMGFADRSGKIVIEPQFDFAAPFNYGYARVCNGCHWEDTDSEHKTVTGGQWEVINFKGEKILPSKTKKNKDDVEIEGKYYPYPFSYSEKEQKILDFFNGKMKLLADIEYVNRYNKLDEDKKVLYFEIVERPSSDFPFYLIYSYDYRKYHKGLKNEFLVAADGQEVFYKDALNKKTPFKKWLKQKTERAKEYQKKRTNTSNKSAD